MSQFPTGSYIRKGNERRKILGEAGEVRFSSWSERDEEWETRAYDWSHVQELIRDGWVEEKPRWKPERGEGYWYYVSDGSACNDHWKDYAVDSLRLSIGNCFPTREACEAYVNKLKEQAKK